jgi:PAS domain S-box-containing protein
MKEDNKTKKQLVHELMELRSQNAELKKSITGAIYAELVAEESRRYAESIVETFREPLLVLDAELKIISASRNFYRTFKVTPGETIGTFIYDLGNKQWDIPKLRELLEEVLPEKKAFDDFEFDHNFQDIGHKIMLLNARQIYRKDIGAKMILLAIEDITELKRLESLLIDSEEQYRRLFETASDGIVLLEKREGKITNANQATEKMLGYNQKETIGNKLQDIGVLLDMSDFQTTMQNLNKSGIINYRNVKVEPKSGQHIDTEIYLVDRAKLVQCNIRDITERKVAKEALRESEEKFRTIFDSASDGILIADAITKKFLQGNTAIGSMLGYTKEEIESLTIYDIHPPNDISHVLDEFEKQAKGEKVLAENLPVLRKDGSIFYADVSSSPATIGGIHYLAGIFRDITEKKRTAQELKDTLESLRRAVNTTIQVMVSAVETRDPYTAGHQIRSANLAQAIANEMGLSQEKIKSILIAGSIHDIGKLSIPAEILSKPTKLSELEFLLIKEHAKKGYEILKDVESPWPLAEIVYQHHERMDGSGYPRKLKGEEILIEARILAVADVLEAMASHRPYRPGLGIEAALEEIEKNKVILYDDAVADACLRLFQEKGFKLEKP